MTRNLPHRRGSTGRALKLGRTRILVVLTVVLLGSSACSDDSTGKRTGDRPDGGQFDAGNDTELPDAESTDAGKPDAGDATSPDADPPPPSTRAQSLCATAGVARGDGLVLYQCTGQAAPAGEVATGGGFTLQAGVTRLITP